MVRGSNTNAGGKDGKIMPYNLESEKILISKKEILNLISFPIERPREKI